MANFAYVEDNKVVAAYDNLPTNWKNYSNFFALEGETDYLKSLGWYSVVYQTPEYNPETQRLGEVTYTLTDNNVIESHDVYSYTPDTSTTVEKSAEQLAIEAQIAAETALANQWNLVRSERDALIANAIWRVQRYERQVRLGQTLIDDITALDTYIQALADIPGTNSDPFNITWPAL